MHQSSQQPQTHNNHNKHNNFQNNRHGLSADDPFNSIKMSLADLSVGGNNYNPTQPQPHQEYVPAGNQGVVNQAHSTAPGSGQSQLSDLIGGGGEIINWGASAASASASSGLIRQQSTSSNVSHPNQQHYNNNHHNSSNNLNNNNDLNEHRKRGESIDKFLSRSPSQTLGTDFLSQFRTEDNARSMPSLNLDMSGSNHNRQKSLGMVGQQQHGSFSDSHVTHHSRRNSYTDNMHVNANSNGNGNGNADNNGNKIKHGKDTSPSCSVTGTSASSRSVSPSWTPNALHDGMRRGVSTGGMGHTIDQYKYHQSNVSVPPVANTGVRGSYNQDLNNSYESFSSSHQMYSANSNSYENFNAHGGVNVNSNFLDTSRENYHGLNNPSHNLPNGREDHQFSRQQQIMTQGYNPNMNDNSILKQTPQQQPPLPKETKPQQQVFYMAVPTEDGQGQVLQPVQMQMVQIPGQPNAFVLPTASHPSNIVGVSAMGQGGPMSIAGGVGGLQSPQVHAERKSYNHMQGSRHQVDMTNGQQYIEENVNFGQGYPEENVNFGARATRGHVEQRREPAANGITTDIVANLYASPQRPPLRELLGHVRRLSRDQVGCRLLQQALDEEGASAASLILKEGLSFWGEAMVDPFGNYLFQKILEKITAEERIVLVQNVSPRLVNASLNLHGTRSVQKVVELCAIDEKESSAQNVAGEQKQETASEILTRSLTPAAARLCIDSHGNHVIQRILLKLPYRYSHFVFDAVANSVGDVARHRHGCCVIQRCLDSPPSTARSNLVRRIVEKSLELMQDAYGNYVVQYVLDVCSDEDVHAVCESVVGKVTLLAIQKFSSNVMEKCLERCTDKVRELYLTELSDSERIRELMMDPFGNYVIQRALAVSTHAQAVQLVEAMKPHLFSPTGGGIKNTAGGRRILAKISKRFPNFSLGDEIGENTTSNVQKNGHKKNGNSRHDNNLSGEQTSARFNRRGQGKADEYSDQHKRLDNSRHGRTDEKVGQWDRVQS